MSLALLILRPQKAAAKTANKAKELGLNPIVDPLFEIAPVEWQAPAASRYNAILFSSANAVQLAGQKLEKYQQLPALAVGAATENAARNAGFKVEVTGDGGVQSMVESLPEQRFVNILRLTGRHYTSVETTLNIESKVVYESNMLGLRDIGQQCLSSECVTLLHSSRAAEKFKSEVERLKIDQRKIQIIAISAAVEKAAGTGWKSTTIAEQPTDDALLSAASTLCLAN